MDSILISHLDKAGINTLISILKTKYGKHITNLKQEYHYTNMKWSFIPLQVRKTIAIDAILKEIVKVEDGKTNIVIEEIITTWFPSKEQSKARKLKKQQEEEEERRRLEERKKEIEQIKQDNLKFWNLLSTDCQNEALNEYYTFYIDKVKERKMETQKEMRLFAEMYICERIDENTLCVNGINRVFGYGEKEYSFEEFKRIFPIESLLNYSKFMQIMWSKKNK